LFFLLFTWGRHRRARATTALPRATSLELLILFGAVSPSQQGVPNQLPKKKKRERERERGEAKQSKN
jgi:hypothetical protein